MIAHRGAEFLARGWTHPYSKLTSTDIEKIRASYAAGFVTMRKLGAQYGVSAQTIHNIVHRKRWKDVEEP